MDFNRKKGEAKTNRKCSVCGNDTNHKSGICIACNFDREFGQMETPASRHSATKKHQGTEGGTLALSSSYPNKKLKRYARAQISQHKQLLYDLELLLKAQIGHIFDLVHDGKFYEATKRINIIQKELTTNKGSYVNRKI